jgi:hypothetical protein
MDSRHAGNPTGANGAGGSVWRALAYAGLLCGRSFFPLAALVIIVGTPWWGPWITLVLALVCWTLVMRLV